MSQQWFVGRGGNQEGPFSSAQLRRLVESGQLSATDLVWREGIPDWVPASSIKGLLPAFTVGASDFNPYTAPASNMALVESAGPAASMAYADYLARVGAALLDGLFLSLIQCLPAGLIAAVFLVLAGDSPDARAGGAALASICSGLLGLVISFVYCLTLETSAKQGTWGKQIVGIKVTDLEGRRITAGRAAGRWFAKFLTGCTLGIGLLMPLFTEKKQTLHDMIAGCLALKK